MKRNANVVWNGSPRSGNDLSSSLYASFRKYSDKNKTVALSMANVAINGWNRMPFGFHKFRARINHKIG